MLIIVLKQPLKKQRGGLSEPIIPIFQKMELLHIILDNPFQAKAYANNTKLIKAYLMKEDKERLKPEDLSKIGKMEGVGKETVKSIR